MEATKLANANKLSVFTHMEKLISLHVICVSLKKNSLLCISERLRATSDTEDFSASLWMLMSAPLWRHLAAKVKINPLFKL